MTLKMILQIEDNPVPLRQQWGLLLPASLTIVLHPLAIVFFNRSGFDGSLPNMMLFSQWYGLSEVLQLVPRTWLSKIAESIFRENLGVGSVFDI